MKASRLRREVDLLRGIYSRDNALADVARLYELLPGRGVAVNFAAPPPVVDVESTNHHSFRRKSLKNAFLKKFKGFTFGNPREYAKKDFLRYEAHCVSSNEFIRNLRQGGHPHLQSILLMAQHKIAKVLGEFTLEELLVASRWGPGSTSSCKGSLTASATKFSSRPDVTKEFLPYARLLVPLLPSWSALLCDVDYGVIANPIMPLVRGNKVTFVPKDAKTHRTIAVEPHINVFFQAGLGQLIRKRMKRYARIDLEDQSLNQRLAQLGSRDDSLSTLDLSGASDTLCRELVRDLLPERWFEWLDAARSHFGELDGEFIRYAKFSSMGNGSTFDLESLIFWAISSAVVENEGYNSFWVNVFGDDIVVPSGAAESVIATLESLGMIVNKDKSFLSGPFRESCGKDYYLGYNTRPIYLKGIPTRAIDWIILCNSIRILSHRWMEGEGCCQTLKTAYDFALSRVPKEFHHLRVPYGFELRRNMYGGFEGNGLLGNWDEAAPTRAEDGFDGWYVKAVGPKAHTVTCKDRRLVTARVHQSSEWSKNELSLRERFSYREMSLYVPFSWYNLGPWV